MSVFPETVTVLVKTDAPTIMEDMHAVVKGLQAQNWAETDTPASWWMSALREWPAAAMNASVL